MGVVLKPGPDQAFDSRYRLGGLQSLAAREGCIPLQPRMMNIVPISFPAPRDRRPPGPELARQRSLFPHLLVSAQYVLVSCAPRRTRNLKSRSGKCPATRCRKNI